MFLFRFVVFELYERNEKIGFENGDDLKKIHVIQMHSLYHCISCIIAKILFPRQSKFLQGVND